MNEYEREIIKAPPPTVAGAYVCIKIYDNFIFELNTKILYFII